MGSNDIKNWRNYIVSAREESEDYWNGLYGEDGYRQRLRELDREAEELEYLRSSRAYRAHPAPKYMFGWCLQCKLVDGCYPNGSGPNYLDPTCSKNLE
jgi:hypothetical protein